ncbi:MAG TPA: glycosyltransferase [Patescibacteria group bacterium]|nr:glycosyltransferase [Patescibacteria group bacterium]
MKIVVIIPTYNEKENIAKMIEVLEKEVFPKIKKYEMSILVVDDHSPDGTAEVVKEKMKKYKNVELSLGKKEGLGAAYIRGMKQAMEKMEAVAVIEFDADFQHDPQYIIDLVKKFDQGYDHVIGSRFIKGGLIPKEWGLFRKILTTFGGLFSRIVLFFPKINIVKDTTTGLKLTRTRGVLDQIDFSRLSSGFFYKTQILYQLVQNKAKIVEIPLRFKVREIGRSKLSSKDVIVTLISVILLRLQDPKTIQFMKFAVVGFIGYLVNAIGLEVFYRAGFSPGPATAIATELAIISNFILNNIWTFAEKKIVSLKQLPYKFIQFNLTSMGALIIQTIVVWAGTSFFGDQWRQIFLILAIGFLVLPYNFFMYTTFIWKTRKSKLFGRIQRRIG